MLISLKDCGKPILLSRWSLEHYSMHGFIYRLTYDGGTVGLGSEVCRQWLNFYSNQILVVGKTVGKISQRKFIST